MYMPRNLARDTYARLPRSSRHPRSAAYESVPSTPAPASDPVAPHVASVASLMHGMTYAKHHGAMPWDVSCTCDCHGDPSSPCDDRTCRAVVSSERSLGIL